MNSLIAFNVLEILLSSLRQMPQEWAAMLDRGASTASAIK